MSALRGQEVLRVALARTARRWRNRRLLEGACVTLLGTSLVAVLAIAFMDSQRFEPGVVALARAGVYLAGAILVLVYMVTRVPWRRDAGALARQLEARDPALDALLLTAVQVHRDGDASALSQRLFQHAAQACDDPAGATRVDRIGQRRTVWLLAAIIGVLVLAWLLAGPAWRHGALLLAWPPADARAGMPYALLAEPGEAMVLETADLIVRGKALGFAPDAMMLVQRRDGESQWTRIAMQAGEGDGGFDTLLAGVRAPFEYYLESQSVRTPTFRVAVQWLPRLEAMQHRYRFPDYTARSERVVDAATHISAVQGTQVELRLRAAALPAAGELVLDADRRRPLLRDGDELLASVGVDEATRYRIELATADGVLVSVTPEYDIRALPDRAPVVTLVSPATDARVTSIEEVRIEVHARDDVKLREVELLLSVNGEPEEIITLHAAKEGGGKEGGGEQAGGEAVHATHIVQLEQRAMAPGDVIALHARASDGVPERTAVTDLLFMEVRPFDRDYRRAASGGQGGGGGGEEEQGLAAQQRDLVVALFRSSRDAASLSEQERGERLSVLSDAQARIRGRVEAIVRRIQGRPMVQSAPGYRVMLDEMPRAANAMTRVEALLAVPAAEEALPRAREALAHLQRADAAFREVRVATQQGAGGGGGGRTDSGDLSRLFELEMDRLRNRYAQVQRAAPQQQRQQQRDQTLQKLEELARRQQQEVERARLRSGRDDLAGRGVASQQQLADELEELLRRLERLTREQSTAAMDAAQRALQEAAQAMRQAGGQESGQQQGQQQGQQGRSTGQHAAGQQDAQGQAGGQQAGQQAPGRSGGQPGGQQSGGVQAPRKADGQAGELRASGQAAAGAGDAERAARAALERIERAREALSTDGPAQVARDLEDARARAESLAERQQQMREALLGSGASGAQSDPPLRITRRGRPPGEGARPDPARAGSARPAPQSDGPGEAGSAAQDGGDAAAQAAGGQGDVRADPQAAKAAMEADAAALREQLDRIADEAGSAQPEVARRTRSAASLMREEDVEGRLRRSREELAAGVPDPGLENALARALERVRARVDAAALAAADGAGDGEGEVAGMPTAEGLRALMRELAGLRDGARDAAGGGFGPGGWDASRWQGVASSLDRLRGPVAFNQAASGDLDALIRGIESLAADEDAIASGASRRAFLDALTGAERAIAGLAADARGDVVLPAGRDARTPDRYRALVEAYYRRLGRD